MKWIPTYRFVPPSNYGRITPLTSPTASPCRRCGGRVELKQSRDGDTYFQCTFCGAVQ